MSGPSVCLPLAIDFSLKRFNCREDVIKFWRFTDDHFVHACIILPKRGSELIIRRQAKGSRFGIFIICLGGFEKDRFMVGNLRQQIETLKRATLGLMRGQLRHVVVVARPSIRERLVGIFDVPRSSFSR